MRTWRETPPLDVVHDLVARLALDVQQTAGVYVEAVEVVPCAAHRIRDVRVVVDAELRVDICGVVVRADDLRRERRNPLADHRLRRAGEEDRLLEPPFPVDEQRLLPR